MPTDRRPWRIRPRRLRAHAALALALAVVSGACSGERGPGEEEGEPRVVGTAPVEGMGFRNVVTLTPEGASPTEAPADTLLMDQLGLAFFPTFLVVRPGQTVEFRNSEITDHNVQVRWLERDSTLFNVGSTRGDPFFFTFEREGGYAVSCDIHSGMSARIAVVDEPWAAPVGQDGTFSLADVPEGSYRLRLWSLDPALRTERRVELGPTGTVTVDFR